MPPSIILIAIIVIVVGTIIYMRYRASTQKRVHEKKRNIYNDRI